MITRRLLLTGMAGVAWARHAWAVQTVTLLVGSTPGSATDTSARTFARFLARHLPDSSLGVVNVPGAAGLAALQALARAEPTGTTLAWAVTPTLPARMIDRGIDDLMQRLTLIGAVEKEPIAIVSAPTSPLNSVADIVAKAADDADAVPLGTPPPGSPPHLAALRLQALAGTRLNIVAFPSATVARQAAIAGNVSAAALGLSSAIVDLREGRLTGLGVAAVNRADAFPDLPPLRDSGLDFSALIRRGLAAPAGISDDAASRLIAAMRAVSGDPEFRELANASGYAAGWRDGATWAAEAEAERTELAKLWATEPWLQEGAD